MSKKNEAKKSEAKVGDMVVMNQYYVPASKGDVGKVLRIFGDGDIYKIKIQGKHPFITKSERFDLVGLAPGQPVITKPPEKKPGKKGIRITVREVKPDVFGIVDFTALDYGFLPLEYINGYPRVSVVASQINIVKAKGCVEWLSRGDFLTGEMLDELVKTCEEAGKRLREINTFPKEPFEIVI